MSDIDIPEEVGDYIENEHIETVFEGFVDTIDGTEGMTLTSAQVYLNGVMMANGVMTSREYAGNEGIFTAIGDGIKKVWEYIKSLFRKIFGGEKKKNAETQTQKLEDKIEKTEKKVEKAIKDPIPPINSQADLDKFMGVVEKKGFKIPETQAEKDLMKSFEETRQAIKDLKEKAEKAEKNMHVGDHKEYMPPELKAAVEKVLEKSFKAHMFERGKALEAQKRIEGFIQRLQEIKEEHEKTDDHSDMAGSIQRFVNGLIGLDHIEKVQNHQTALAWVQKCGRCKQAMGNTWMEIFNSQQTVQKRITELEGKLNHFDKSNAQDPLKKDIEELKANLTKINSVDWLMNNVTLDLGKLVDMIGDACIAA